MCVFVCANIFIEKHSNYLIRTKQKFHFVAHNHVLFHFTRKLLLHEHVFHYFFLLLLLLDYSIRYDTMDMNYGCDVSNRYTGYLDSSDHGNAMSNAAGKNKRKTKKKRKPKNSAEKVVTAVDKCTNTSQIIECDGEGDGGVPSEQEQQQPPQQFPVENHRHHNENDVQYTDEPTSLISTDSTVQSYTSKETKESDSQSNNTITEDQTTTTEIEAKWSEICCEEERAIAAAAAAAEAAAATAAMDEQKLRDEPELVFKDQRIYPTVYFYNSNFGPRNRRVVYDFHDGRNNRGGRDGRDDRDGRDGRGGRDGSGSGGGFDRRRRDRGYSNNYNQHDASRARQQPVSSTQVDNTAVNAESTDQMQENKQKKRRNRNNDRRRRKNYSDRSDTNDYNHPGGTNEMHSNDATEKYSKVSHNESNDRRSSPPPPVPQPASHNNNNGPQEYPKNRYNKFRAHGMPERTFSRRRTDLVRNV